MTLSRQVTSSRHEHRHPLDILLILRDMSPAIYLYVGSSPLLSSLLCAYFSVVVDPHCFNTPMSYSDTQELCKCNHCDTHCVLGRIRLAHNQPKPDSDRFCCYNRMQNLKMVSFCWLLECTGQKS